MTTYFGTDLTDALFTQAQQISRTVLDIDLPIVRNAVKNAASYVPKDYGIVDVVESELDIEISLISRKIAVAPLKVGDVFILVATNLSPSCVEYTADEIRTVEFEFIEYKVLPIKAKSKTLSVNPSWKDI